MTFGIGDEDRLPRTRKAEHHRLEACAHSSAPEVFLAGARRVG